MKARSRADRVPAAHDGPHFELEAIGRTLDDLSPAGKRRPPRRVRAKLAWAPSPRSGSAPRRRFATVGFLDAAELLASLLKQSLKAGALRRIALRFKLLAKVINVRRATKRSMAPFSPFNTSARKVARRGAL